MCGAKAASGVEGSDRDLAGAREHGLRSAIVRFETCLGMRGQGNENLDLESLLPAVLLSIPSLLLGQTTTTQKAFSPRQFVEGFYRWYLPIILNPQTSIASDVALKYKASAFSPELLRLLKADSAAQAGCEDLIGLDFDPFLYTQDSEGHYEVGKITQTGQSYRAEIYGVRSGVRFDKPSVIAEFTVKSGHWFL